MYCPNCGVEIGSTDKYCPRCGSQVSEKNKKTVPIKVLLSVVVLCSVVALLITMISKNIGDKWATNELVWDEDIHVLANRLNAASPMPDQSGDIYDIRYEVISEDGDNYEWVWQKYTYDNNGNYIRIVSYSPDGAEDSAANFTYDMNGNMTSHNVMLSSGEYWFWNVYNYDSENREILECSYGIDGKLRWVTRTQYSDDGKRGKSEHFNVSENTLQVSETIYDSQGSVIEEQYSRYEGNDLQIYKRSCYAYNDNGNVVSCVIYDVDDAEKGRETYVYDESGNQVLREFYSSELSEINKLIYDDNGNMLSYITYADGTMTRVATYTYDENGNENECLIKDGNGFVVKWRQTTYLADGSKEIQTPIIDGAEIKEYEVLLQ